MIMPTDPASTESGKQETEIMPEALCQGVIFAFSYNCQFLSLIIVSAKITNK
jgi:hypothetical protein